MSIVQKLTENIVARDLSKEGAALLNKWEKTGLLEGIEGEHGRETMSRLLENQAKELLREASTMSAGDVEGFAAVAFPIVRRVFGGLIANQLVSVQPMSLPSGLIFFMDFQHADGRIGYEANDSVYGGGRVGAEITGGVLLGRVDGQDHAEKGFYSLNQGYSSPLSSSLAATNPNFTLVASTSKVGSGDWPDQALVPSSAYTALGDALVLHDPDLSGSRAHIWTVPKATFSQLNEDAFITLTLSGAAGTAAELNTMSDRQVRRLTRKDPNATDNLLIVLASTGNETDIQMRTSFGGLPNSVNSASAEWAVTDNFAQGDQVGSVVGAADWLLESDTSGVFSGEVSGDIPEIDIKVDSVAITAITKKLKAKWSPELGQDLNAYHNLDAEVELTSILSEQIALEIDREILGDLVKGATAGTIHWSRRPGQFLDRENGTPITSSTAPPDFTGTVSEWYETLLESVNDVSARIHRKTIRGGANFVVCGPEVATIMEFTAGFRANVAADSNTGTSGAVKVGSVSKKWDIYVDPYFPRNLVLVGRKGGSFLESGYVYAPYVPLQVTPTIFQPEDFTPRKGVLTRYAKKMVRPDMYGLVVVHDLTA